MSRTLTALLAIVCCTGCATRLNEAGEAGGEPRMPLSFQRLALDPANGGRQVQAEALQPGDILLTAVDAITSTGIRMLTLAPVSHAAIYLGERQVVEAVGSGVRIRALDDVLADESVVVAFRHPKITALQGEKIRAFSNASVGGGYNHVGIVLQAPFSIERRMCELPLVPESIRDFCIRGVASIQLGASRNDQFFCSQFVLEAYRQAGLPITDADPRMISPADILHMREGDVSSVRIHQPLTYVGHLKYRILAASSE
ncbi:YaeF family permuted papain-like enzyme [soil metagenome]